LRTILYIDGFNFFYGKVKNTPFKWLNLKRLGELCLANKPGKPVHNIVGVKYFTAQVINTPTDPDKANRQQRYWDALKSHTPEIEIILGQNKIRQNRGRLIEPPHLAAQAGANRVTIEKFEEKGTDVNLGVHLVSDAYENKYECAVLISNDSDLAEALKIARYNCNKTIGWMPPITNYRYNKKRFVAELDALVHFKKPIRVKHLQGAQLPNIITGTSIRKPRDW